ncbi:hypothetical protein Pla108_34200 [Botrimarina colliarenosi]|uniref:CorA-like Mg2+ transporter protein n=1 Tax=Botrimarina colliarenosi TaxID=2528001 RepID=A0A5C6A764_9BACT|nr:hypothetical protein [Botrimarina colliarenosi]TWT95276.1 hypothetical protein Pla108_34200 [Botrimarina colliarenosi]
MANSLSAPRLGNACPLLPPSWDVPKEFRERLGDDVGRQRMVQADGHLLLVLHAPPRSGEDHRVGRLFWRNPQGQWKPAGLTHSEPAIAELLSEYERMATEIDTLEDGAAAAEDYFDILTELGPMTRSANNLSTVLEESRLVADDDRLLLLMRDRAYALVRRLDLMQKEAKTSLDFVVARRAEEQAESARHQAAAAHRLNLLVAFFFPLATLAAVLGMNLSNGLEQVDVATAPAPLLVVSGLALALGGVLAWLVSRC